MGSTIYLNPTSKWPTRDLASDNSGDDLELLMHETTHTVQYRELGYAVFLAHYGSDMAAVRGDAREMYRYWNRHRPFGREMIEGQAEMVGNYTTLRRARDPKLQPRRADLQRRLEGTGYHGL